MCVLGVLECICKCLMEFWGVCAYECARERLKGPVNSLGKDRVGKIEKRGMLCYGRD